MYGQRCGRRMGRPCIPRRVRGRPNADYFKPRGIPMHQLETVTLTMEEAEALRLKDLEGKEQEECAKSMRVSRRTFVRILRNAREKVSDAIFHGKAIEIKGGNFMQAGIGRGGGRGMRTGIGGAGGRGRMGGFAAGPGGTCQCPKCGYQGTHQIGVPCNQQTCPKCGSKMSRG